MDLARAQTFLAEHDVKFILAQFVDIHGVAKTKAVPSTHLKDLITDGAGFAGFALWGFGMKPNSPDYMAIADLHTLTLVPWMPGFARVVCVGHVNGKPYPYDCRYVLMQSLEKLQARGWTLNVGIEPELQLLTQRADGKLMPYDSTDTLEKPCYDFKGLANSINFIQELVSSLQIAGFDVYQIDHEDANGQFEINYTYSDCLTACDRHIFFKMAAVGIARNYGMIASFMPKPFPDRTGTGQHYHLSLADRQGNNLFHHDGDPQGLGLSQLAYHFLAGLLHHAPALTAICAPTVNSYKRLVVGRSLSGATWAPAYICYGNNNRSAMVRIPYGRLELRLADGSANPYLVATAIIAAGLDGIDRQLAVPPPINENLYDLSEADLQKQGIATLPQNLGSALDALAEDQVLMSALGVLGQEFIDLKRMEYVEYQRHVSDWEIKRYLEFF